MNRYYDGNGREVKRGGRDFRTFPSGQSNWIERQAIYYIRSSISGNEVISEVDWTGKRTKGYVRAAGTTLAMQTGARDVPIKFSRKSSSLKIYIGDEVK